MAEPLTTATPHCECGHRRDAHFVSVVGTGRMPCKRLCPCVDFKARRAASRFCKCRPPKRHYDDDGHPYCAACGRAIAERRGPICCGCGSRLAVGSSLCLECLDDDREDRARVTVFAGEERRR